MHFYEASQTICAPVSRVWGILTDAAAYPTWDSGVDAVEGIVAPGESITVHATVSPGRSFPVKVGDFVAEKTMTWTGGMPLGLFTGVRTFTLAPEKDDCTRFTMREEYHGPMVPVIWKSMPDLQPSFDQFAAGLKERAERQ
jgi:hypothetical protein